VWTKGWLDIVEKGFFLLGGCEWSMYADSVELVKKHFGLGPSRRLKSSISHFHECGASQEILCGLAGGI
jgi:hypothetical protein